MAAMTPPRFGEKASRLVRWRMAIQAAFLLVWLDPLLLRLHNVCGPVFHCYACPLSMFACPIGVLANFSALHVFPFMAVGTLLVVSGIFAGFICGWACPFGFLQDLVGRIPTRKFELPAWTTHLRYVVLAVTVLAVPYLWGEGHPLFICRVCPAGALEGAMVNVGQSVAAGTEIAWPSTLKLVILGLFVVAMFVKWRPWCTLFCPLGAIFGFFNRASAIYLRYHPEACTQCGRCASVCRHGVEPHRRISDPNCVRCLECTRCGEIAVDTVFSRPKPSDEGKSD